MQPKTRLTTMLQLKNILLLEVVLAHYFVRRQLVIIILVFLILKKLGSLFNEEISKNVRQRFEPIQIDRMTYLTVDPYEVISFEAVQQFYDFVFHCKTDDGVKLFCSGFFGDALRFFFLTMRRARVFRINLLFVSLLLISLVRRLLVFVTSRTFATLIQFGLKARAV